MPVSIINELKFHVKMKIKSLKVALSNKKQMEDKNQTV